jgi:hypothetical protein
MSPGQLDELSLLICQGVAIDGKPVRWKPGSCKKFHCKTFITDSSVMATVK